jgi:signal transduction histidine kinase
VDRVAQLEKRLPCVVEPGPAVTVSADGDQLDQLLINLVSNAVEAATETGGGRARGVARRGRGARGARGGRRARAPVHGEPVHPFFTTKRTGTGIGLALSRQIAEAHGGTLTLEDRSDGARGCVATLRLPV